MLASAGAITVIEDDDADVSAVWVDCVTHSVKVVGCD